MTDDELLSLLETKSPEEFTIEEIEALRMRLRESEALRQAVFDTVRLESRLTAALGAFSLNIDDLVHRAEKERRRQGSNFLWTSIGTLALVGLIVLFGLLVRAAITSSGNESPHIAQQSETIEPEPSEKPRTHGEESPKSDDPPPMEPTTGESKVEATSPDPSLQPVAPNPAPVNKPIEEPWTAELAKDAASLPKFSDVSLRDFEYRKFLPRAADLQKWLAPYPGHELKIYESPSRNGNVGAFDGTARVKAPFPADGGIRLALKKDSKLRMYVYAGEEGVVFKHLSEPRELWSVFRVRRTGNELKPSEYILYATDEERSRRTDWNEGGPFEVRYLRESREIAMLRGDIELVRAPLSNPPSDFVLSGKAIVEGIELLRTSDAPGPKAPPEPTHRLVPAELEWTEKLGSGVAMTRNDDGSITLASEKNDSIASIAAPIPGFGPREITFTLEQATPGCFVFFGRGEKGEYIPESLKFVRNKRSDKLGLQMHAGVTDVNEIETESFPEKFERAVAPNVRIKLLYGCGVLQWRTSHDGVNWAAGDAVSEWATENVRTLGIGLGKNGDRSGAVLKSISVRELPMFAKLAPRELVEQAPVIVKPRDYAAWHTEMSMHRVIGNDPAVWRRACAIRTLGDGAVAPVTVPIMERLLEDSRTLLDPLERLELLRESMLMAIDIRSGQQMKRGIVDRMRDWAYEHAGNREFDAFTLARRAMQDSPASTYHWFTLNDHAQLERWLLRDRQMNDRDVFRRHLAEVGIFRWDRDFPTIDWFEYSARTGNDDRSTRTETERRASWQSIWSEELSKDAYNFAAELQSLLEGGAAKEAAERQAGLEPDLGNGLTPAADDSGWFHDLAIALRMAAKKHPALAEEMKRNAPLAELRVRNAAAGGDEQTLRLAAVQFAGTEAAAEAHRRLGDRALQNGWFAAAEAEYREARTGASAELARELPARLRFAAAMQGREVGSPATSNVTLGGTVLSAADFETLVQEMRSRGGDAHRDAAFETPVSEIPSPAALAPRVLSKLDGPHGTNPKEEGMRGINESFVDWTARQTAHRIAGDALYVANRFELAAYRLSDGSRLWQTKPASGEMRRSQDTALVPMRPLVLGDSIVVRTLYGKSVSLSAFARADGKPLWHKEGTTAESWASDPIVVQGQTGAIRHVRGDRASDRLVWTTFDPLTGDLLQTRSIMQVRDVFQFRKTCEIKALGDGFLLSLDGLALRCDAAGAPMWVRRFETTPIDPFYRSVRQWYETPRTVGERAILIRPGGHTIDCVAIDSGELLWSHAVYEPRRIIAADERAITLETQAGFLALRTESGEVVWEAKEEFERLAGAIASDKLLLYSLRRPVKDQDRSSPVLVWRNLETGEETGRFALPPLSPDAKHVRLGPFIAHGGKLWSFIGRENDPPLELAAFESQGAVRLQPYRSLVDHWPPVISAPLIEAVAERFADWQLVSVSEKKGTKDFGFREQFQTEKDVVLLSTATDLPIAVRYNGNLPEKGKIDLTLRLGRAEDQKGAWQVVCGGKLIGEKGIDPAIDKERWFDWSLSIEFGPDLPNRDLMVVYRPAEGTEQTIAIRRLRVTKLDSAP